LKAIALSVQRGGHIGKVVIGGLLATLGDGVVTLQVEGRLDKIEVGGGIAAFGEGSDAVHTHGPIRGLDSIRLEAKTGQDTVVLPA
jgi:hypothetical protein